MTTECLSFVFIDVVGLFSLLSLSLIDFDRGAILTMARATSGDRGSGGNERGCQGMGVVSNNCFDRVLLSIIHTFKPSC